MQQSRSLSEYAARKCLFERQPDEEMEGQASTLPPPTGIRTSLTIIAVGTIDILKKKVGKCNTIHEEV